MIEGWCIPCRADRPSTEDRRCSVCGHILIPPSWASKDAPYPWSPRPEGWSWTQPVDGEPTKPAARQRPVRPPVEPEAVALTCAWCKRTVQVESRGGSAQRYCSVDCRHKATSAMTAARKRAARKARTAAAPPLPQPCRRCGVVYQPVAPPKGGPASPYCGDECKREAKRANRRAA